MMPSGHTCSGDLYYAPSGLNEVLGRLPRALTKAAFCGFHRCPGLSSLAPLGLQRNGQDDARLRRRDDERSVRRGRPHSGTVSERQDDEQRSRTNQGPYFAVAPKPHQQPVLT